MTLSMHKLRFLAGDGKPIVHQIDTFISQLNQFYSKLYANPDEAYRQSKTQSASMRRDPVIMTPLRARQMAVVFQDWSILPEDEKDSIQHKVCDEIKRTLENCPYFFKLKMSLLEAIWFGRYAANIIYEWKRPAYQQVQIAEWRPIDGDKLKFEYDTGRVGIMVSRNSSDEPDDRELRYTDESRAIMVKDDQRRALVIHKHEVEDGTFYDPWSAGSIHGVGVRSRIYWPWFLKQKCLQWTMTGAETSALGIEIYYYDSGNPESEGKMRKVAENRQEDQKIFIPRPIGQEGQGNGIERLDSNAQFQFLLQLTDDYFGDMITRAIVGQTMTSQADASGLGAGVADEHRKTFTVINRYDAANLDDTLTRELVRVIAETNYPGIDWKPRYVTVIEPPDPQKFIEAARAFQQMGGELGETDVREKIGMPKPKKHDRILGQSGPMPGGQQSGQDAGQPGQIAPPKGMAPAPAEPEPEQFREREVTREPLRYSVFHAPEGGIDIDGKHFAGGQFVPSKEAKKATPEQRKQMAKELSPTGKHAMTVLQETAEKFRFKPTGEMKREIAGLAREHADNLHEISGDDSWAKHDRQRLNDNFVRNIADVIRGHHANHLENTVDDLTANFEDDDNFEEAVPKTLSRLKRLGIASPAIDDAASGLMRELRGKPTGDEEASDLWQENGGLDRVGTARERLNDAVRESLFEREHDYDAVRNGLTEPSYAHSYLRMLDHLNPALAGFYRNSINQKQNNSQQGDPLRFSRTDSELNAILREAASKIQPPTDAQRESENYRKGHCRIHGLPITLETGRGQSRSGVSKSGKRWSVKLPHHYGYIKNTESEADGDHIDVFVGPNPSSQIVYVVDQNKPDGTFDEHKCMLGFLSEADAKDGYLASYSPGWKGFSAITALTMDQFKRWIQRGDSKGELSRQRLLTFSRGEPVRYERDSRLARLRRRIKEWKSEPARYEEGAAPCPAPAMPGGNNTYIPGLIVRKRKKKRKESAGVS